jgi:hypothetical protein
MQTCYLISFSQIILQLNQQTDTYQNAYKNMEMCIYKHITHTIHLHA